MNWLNRALNQRNLGILSWTLIPIYLEISNLRLIAPLQLEANKVKDVKVIKKISWSEVYFVTIISEILIDYFVAHCIFKGFWWQKEKYWWKNITRYVFFQHFQSFKLILNQFSIYVNVNFFMYIEYMLNCHWTVQTWELCCLIWINQTF